MMEDENIPVLVSSAATQLCQPQFQSSGFLTEAGLSVLGFLLDKPGGLLPSLISGPRASR